MADTGINPKILTWAREIAGLSVEEAAEKLGLKDTAKATAVEKLQDLEDGKRVPRDNQGDNPACREHSWMRQYESSS
jgi:hypothetical protein